MNKPKWEREMENEILRYGQLAIAAYEWNNLPDYYHFLRCRTKLVQELEERKKTLEAQMKYLIGEW